MNPGDAPTLVIVIGAVTGLFAGFAKLVMWCVTKWLEDRAAERLERKEERAQDREATKAVATAMTTMALKFDAFEKQLSSVQWNVEEITGRHEVPIPPSRNTPPAGVPIPGR